MTLISFIIFFSFGLLILSGLIAGSDLPTISEKDKRIAKYTAIVTGIIGIISFFILLYLIDHK